MKNPTAPFETVGLRASAAAAALGQTELQYVAPAVCVGREAHLANRLSSFDTIMEKQGGEGCDSLVRSPRISFRRRALLPAGVVAAAVAVDPPNDSCRRLSYRAPSVGRQFNHFAHFPSLSSMNSVCDKRDHTRREQIKWSVNQG